MRDPANDSAPMLSLRERDRRWHSVREMMRAHAVDCLIVPGFRSREHFESYITDDYLEGLVIFPADGQPTTLSLNGSRVSRARESLSRGAEVWVADCRVGAHAGATAAVLREKGLDKCRIGVVGLESSGPGETNGVIPYRYWRELLQELPKAGFLDVSGPFGMLMLVKSEEEIALVRYAASVVEEASRVMLEVTRPGIGEEVIYAEIAREIYRHAADARSPAINLHSGRHNISWGAPRWLSRAERPHRLQEGDLVQAEIIAYYGNQEAQVQMAIGVGPIDEVNQLCADVARRAYEAGLHTIRPGITFAEVVSAMEKPLRDAGCWALTPLVHSLGPGGGTGHTGVNLELFQGTEEGFSASNTSMPRRIGGGDMEIRPGMAFSFQPNACIDTHRVNIGGTVTITETGHEELNELATRLRRV